MATKGTVDAHSRPLSNGLGRIGSRGFDPDDSTRLRHPKARREPRHGETDAQRYLCPLFFYVSSISKSESRLRNVRTRRACLRTHARSLRLDEDRSHSDRMLPQHGRVRRRWPKRE